MMPQQLPAPTAADLDFNAQVNAADLVILLSHWGPVQGRVPADLNEDGFVTASDLSFMMVSWGACGL